MLERRLAREISALESSKEQLLTERETWGAGVGGVPRGRLTSIPEPSLFPRCSPRPQRRGCSPNCVKWSSSCAGCPRLWTPLLRTTGERRTWGPGHGMEEKGLPSSLLSPFLQAEGGAGEIYSTGLHRNPELSRGWEEARDGEVGSWGAAWWGE